MILQAIVCSLRQVNDNEKIKALVDTILLQGLLFTWWLVNFVIINTLGPKLSLILMIVELLYALITLWFFAIISLKVIGYKKFMMFLNPLIPIIMPMFVICLPIGLLVRIFLVSKFYSENADKMVDYGKLIKM